MKTLSHQKRLFVVFTTICSILTFAQINPSAQADTILLEDTFNTENGGVGALNYATLAHWNITNGSVDLIGNGYYDFYPGNGLYLDLDGSTGNAATLESKSIFSLAAGTYELRFDLGNSPGQANPNIAEVRIGTVFSEDFTR